MKETRIKEKNKYLRKEGKNKKENEKRDGGREEGSWQARNHASKH